MLSPCGGLNETSVFVDLVAHSLLWKGLLALARQMSTMIGRVLTYRCQLNSKADRFILQSSKPAVSQPLGNEVELPTLPGVYFSNE